jgi:enolase
MGVRRAVDNVRLEISAHLQGCDVLDQRRLDESLIALDGSDSLSRLGANAVLATSLAASRAAAAHSQLPLHRYINGISGSPAMTLPMPMTNILSGGAHAGRCMDIQDYMVVPIGAQRYSDALDWVCRVRDSASQLMAQLNLPTLLADEGGLSPGFDTIRAALEFVTRAIESAQLRPGRDVAIAIDVAASQLYRDGRYELSREQRQLSGAEMVSLLKDVVREFPVVSIEDALEQDDWEQWQALTAELPQIQIVGDDLFATNVERIRRGIVSRVANSVLIKANQNGTLSGTLSSIQTARSAGYATVISARSGETEDDYIAHLSVGTGAGQIKIGSVRNSERNAKYNELSRIEETALLPFAGHRAPGKPSAGSAARAQ